MLNAPRFATDTSLVNKSYAQLLVTAIESMCYETTQWVLTILVWTKKNSNQLARVLMIAGFNYP